MSSEEKSEHEKKLEEELRILRLKKRIKEENTNFSKLSIKRIVIAVICVISFLLVLFFTFPVFLQNNIDQNISIVFSLIIGGFIVYLILLCSGLIKEFTIKGGSIELSAKLNEELNVIKSDVKESKKDVERLNQTINQMQNLVLNTISNKVHVGDIIQTADEKREKSKQSLTNLGLSAEIDTAKKIELTDAIKQKIESQISESDSYNELIEKMTGHTFKDRHELILRANYYFEAKKYGKSVEIYDKILENEPNDPVTLNNKGLALIYDRKYSQAIDVLKKSLKIRTSDTAMNNLGLAYSYLGKNKDALEWYDKSILIKSNEPKTLSNKAVCLFEMGNIEKALEINKQALDIEPEYVNCLSWRGIMLTAKEKFSDALDCFEQAILINPTYAPSISGRGLVLVLTGETEKGLEMLDDAIEIDSKKGRVFYDKACAKSKLNEKDEAVKLLKIAIDIAPSYKIRAQRDKLFDLLRNDSEFKKLMEN